MKLIRFILATQQRKADREILRVLHRHSQPDQFIVELERRLLGQ